MSMMPPNDGSRPGAPLPPLPGTPEALAEIARKDAEERAKAARALLEQKEKARRMRRRLVLALLVVAAGVAVWWLTPKAGSKPVGVWERRLADAKSKVTGPSLAVSPNGKWFALAWAEGRKVWYLRGTEERGQLRFDSPVALADTTHPFAAFDEDPPKAAVDNAGEVAIAWMTRPFGREEGSVIAVARPNLEHDGALGVTRIESPNPKGFLLCESIAYDDDGGLIATWIDGGTPDTSPGEEGAVQCAIAPPQGAFESITTLADSACSCCRTSMSWLGPEKFAVSYRGVAGGNVRDVRFAVLFDEGEDGEGTPAFARNSHTVVRNDGWEIEGCPSQGPTVAAMGEGSAWVTWYTEGAPRGLYLARLEPRHGAAGTRWNPVETFLVDPRERALHPVVATLSSGRPFVAFDGPTPEGGRALYARVYRNSKLAPPERFTTANKAERATLARWGRNGMLIAWQETDEYGPRIAIAEWKRL